MRKEGRGRPEIAGALHVESIKEILSSVKKIEAERDALIMLANSMAVCGKDHILSAYMHAKRAVMDGSAVARDISIEFLRYLTGERQVSKAIEKGGIKDGCDMAIISEIPVSEIIERLNLQRDDSVLECSEKKAEYLGLSGYIPPSEEALELVAMVEIL